MAAFLSNLLSSSNKVSSRRFIALMLLIPYMSGIFIGIKSLDFNYYLTAMLAAGIPILIAYFMLTWQNISDIVSNIKIRRRNSFDEDYDFNSYNIPRYNFGRDSFRPETEIQEESEPETKSE